MKTFEGWWLETHPLDRDTAFTGSHKSAMKEAWCAAIEASRESQSAVPSNVLVEFLDGLRDYEHEAGHSIADDERESIDFVNIFLSERGIAG